MATTTSCPSCGHKVPIAPEFQAGTVDCPACGNPFEVNIPTLSAANGPSNRPAGRSSSARPELLHLVPTHFLLSPAMVAVGGVGVLFYGVILLGVLSASKNRLDSLDDSPSRTISTVAPLPPTSSTDPSPPAARPPEPSPSNIISSTASISPSTSKPAPPPSPVEPSKPPEIARNTPTKPIASKPSSPEPPPTPPAVPASRGFTWGILSGLPDDNQFRLDGDILTLTVPGSIHILSPELKLKNAPRLLADVSGDFIAQVEVGGRILPGTKPLPSLPFTFQGAGLLIWQDEDNYVRLERTSIFSSADRTRLNQVLVELCRDGKNASDTLRDVRDTDYTLRVERRGSEFRFQYSTDAKTWIEAKRLTIPLPNAIQVGVTASNASPKPFTIRLQDFALTAGK